MIIFGLNIQSKDLLHLRNTRNFFNILNSSQTTLTYSENERISTRNLNENKTYECKVQISSLVEFMRKLEIHNTNNKIFNFIKEDYDVKVQGNSTSKTNIWTEEEYFQKKRKGTIASVKSLITNYSLNGINRIKNEDDVYLKNKKISKENEESFY